MVSPTPALPADNDALFTLLLQVAARDAVAFTLLWRQLAPDVAETVREQTINSADVVAITAATFIEVWWLAPLHDAPGTDIRAWVHAIAQARVTEHNRGSAGMAFIGPMWTSVVNAETIELEVGALLAAGFTT